MDFDNFSGMEGPFGNPLAFGNSDLRVVRIISEGVDALNKAAKEVEGPAGIDAAAALLKTQDPIVKAAILRRLEDAWNTMVNDMSTVEGFLRLFGESQEETFHTFLSAREVLVDRLRREIRAEAQTRMEAGFDQPWNPEEAPKTEPRILSDEEDRVASSILQQFFSGSATHDSDIDH